MPGELSWTWLEELLIFPLFAAVVPETCRLSGLWGNAAGVENPWGAVSAAGRTKADVGELAARVATSQRSLLPSGVLGWPYRGVLACWPKGGVFSLLV